MVEEEGTRDQSSRAGKERWSSLMDDENEEPSSDMFGCPDLRDAWRNWRVDDPELGNDETAEARVNRCGKGRKREDGYVMYAALVDG